MSEQAKMCLDAGADLIMVESEGVTENLPKRGWRTDVIASIINELGANRVSYSAIDRNI